MTKNKKSVEARPEDHSKTEKVKKKKELARKASEAPSMSAEALDFSGRVENIRMKGSNSDALSCEISLRNKNGKSEAYFLDGTDPLIFSAMINLLASASASRQRINLKAELRGIDQRFATEIELQTNKGRSKNRT